MRLFGALERKSTDISALSWAALLGGVGGSKAGVAVNLDTALKVSTVLACTRVLSEGLAALPLKVFRIDGRSRKPAEDLRVYQVLNARPNEWMTSFEFIEFMMIHAVLSFNAYAYIGWGGNEVQELIPIPGPVRVEQMPDYRLRYHLLDTGDVLDQGSVLHLRGPSWNGILGMDALHLAREAVGLAIATEETHARLFANGAHPGGVLSIEKSLSSESKAAIKAKIEQRVEGIQNAFRTLVLDQSAKWTSMAMSGVDAQHIETRRFQAEEICRGMRVFPQMVGLNGERGAPTFASAEQINLWHVTHSLLPWGRRLEQKIGHCLLNNDPKLFAKFNFTALLRGDAAQRATFLEKALGGARGETAWMTKNEARETEDFDPIDDPAADTLPVPVLPVAQPPIVDKTPDDVSAKSSDDRFIETLASTHETRHRELLEAVRAMPAPIVNVEVPVSLPGQTAMKTTVTKFDKNGRIQQFERRPIED